MVLSQFFSQFGQFLNVMLWFMRMQGYAFMSITFQLLTIDAALKYWSSIYYCYFWIIGALYIAALVIRARRPKVATPVVSVHRDFHAIDPPKLSKTEWKRGNQLDPLWHNSSAPSTPVLDPARRGAIRSSLHSSLHHRINSEYHIRDSWLWAWNLVRLIRNDAVIDHLWREMKRFS